MEINLPLMQKKLIVIEGPTASGKTGLSIALAKKLNTCILSADSRQFYKEMSIGTAKPTKAEMDEVPHYFIDSHSIQHELSSGQFEIEALQLLKTLFEKTDIILLVGGSGMFIDALCFGLDPIPHDAALRNSITQEWLDSGLAPLLEELKIKDLDFYNIVDKNNPVRVIRALEVIRLTGKTFTEWRQSNANERFFQSHFFVIDHSREVLYDRINQRVDEMMTNGLLKEVEGLQNFAHLNPLKTVGYQELLQYLNHEITLVEAVELIKQHTRNYAKRQLTWFRKHKEATWISFASNEKMCDVILEKLDALN